MENSAHHSLLTKNEARDLIENGNLPESFWDRLFSNADLVANVWACSNCDDRKCMGCVMRKYDHKCKDDCPFCC